MNCLIHPADPNHKWGVVDYNLRKLWKRIIGGSFGSKWRNNNLQFWIWAGDSVVIIIREWYVHSPGVRQYKLEAPRSFLGKINTKCNAVIWTSCNLHALVFQCHRGKGKVNLGDTLQAVNAPFMNVSDITLKVHVAINTDFSLWSSL